MIKLLLLERHFHDPNQHEGFLREARTLVTLEHLIVLPAPITPERDA